jgi:hypothetical protein
LALNGVTGEQIREAGWTAQSVTGASAYMHSIDYDRARFKQEVDNAVDFIKRSMQKAA